MDAERVGYSDDKWDGLTDEQIDGRVRGRTPPDGGGEGGRIEELCAQDCDLCLRGM